MLVDVVSQHFSDDFLLRFLCIFHADFRRLGFEFSHLLGTARLQFQDKTRHDKTRQVKKRQQRTSHENTRQGKQEKTSPENCSTLQRAWGRASNVG